MANALFPAFTRKQGEDATNFLVDNFEIACFISRRDEDASRFHIFSLLMMVEACSWYNALPQTTKDSWKVLKATFEQCFEMGATCKKLQQLLSRLNKHEGLCEYDS